mgnify:CR=1 FL=1
MNTITSCRFCGSGDKKLWVGNYYRCNDCLFISADPHPSNEEIENHYKGYHENNHQVSEDKNRKRAVSYQQEIMWLKNLGILKNISTIYDYGASGGYFLDAISAQTNSNTALYASDLALGAQSVLKEKGYFKSLNEVRPNSIDLFVMRGVIEHIVDFRQTINDVASTISKDGYFFITATPDASCTVANLYRDAWVQHHYPSHFQHFSSHHLDELLGLVGMVPFAVTELYPGSPYREKNDDHEWLNALIDNSGNRAHAYWGSMMTRLYRKLND